MVSSSCSTTTSVLRWPASSLERVEQDRVVARVQADGRLIEHVADALQVRAELRGEADALRLAARERRRGAVELQVAEADALEELQPRADLGEQVARDLALARPEAQLGEELLAGAHRLARRARRSSARGSAR